MYVALHSDHTTTLFVLGPVAYIPNMTFSKWYMTDGVCYLVVNMEMAIFKSVPSKLSLTIKPTNKGMDMVVNHPKPGDQPGSMMTPCQERWLPRFVSFKVGHNIISLCS